MVPCKLKEVTEFPLVSIDGEKKLGRYVNSLYPEVKDCGTKKFVFGAYIIVDEAIRDLISQGKSEKGIIKECIEFLNQPPARQKFQRRQRESIFGNLSDEPLYVKRVQKDGLDTFSVLLITDKRKNKFLWSEGAEKSSLYGQKKYRRKAS